MYRLSSEVADAGGEDRLDSGDLRARRLPVSVGAVMERLRHRLQFALEYVTGDRGSRHDSRRRVDREVPGARSAGGIVEDPAPGVLSGVDQIPLDVEARVDLSLIHI